MRVPISWLREYVNVHASSSELAEQLCMAGIEIAGITPELGDEVIEIEITANRPDWLSIIGIAHEVAALYNKKLKTPFSVHQTLNELKGIESIPIDIAVHVLNTAACIRYTGHIVEGVHVGPSPAWLARKIELLGLRPINNVVDITNLILFETGQPMHAFDLDQIEGKRIEIRNARAQEKIMLLDDTERTLCPTDLVIADGQRPIALAGIMGGKTTGVTQSTKRVFLESAFFDAVTIRRTARRVGISTDSSYRFERKVDAGYVLPAALRALELIQEITGGKIAAQSFDVGEKTEEPHTICLRPERVEMIIGEKIPARTIESILHHLGFSVQKDDAGKRWVSVPSFRRDIHQEIDLIEEIVRIWGYEKIPTCIPKSVYQEQPVYPLAYQMREKVKDIFVGAGFFEVVSSTLVSKELLKNSAISLEDAVNIQNPLSLEQEMLRRSAIPNMLLQMAYNIKRNNEQLKLFEVGKVYFYPSDNTPSLEGAFPEGFPALRAVDKGSTGSPAGLSAGGYPREQEVVCVGMCGMRFDEWQDAKKPMDYFDLKGVVELLCRELGIAGFTFIPMSEPHVLFSYAAEIKVQGISFGVIGAMNKEMLSSGFDIKKKEIFIAELNLEMLGSCKRGPLRYRPLPRFPSVARDISFMVETSYACAEIMEVLRNAGGDLVADIRLFDEYKGDTIPKGYRSLSYTIVYNSLERSLTDEEVNVCQEKIRAAVKEKYHATIR